MTNRVAEALAATRTARRRVAAGRSLVLEIRRQQAAIWEHRGATPQAPGAGRGER